MPDPKPLIPPPLRRTSADARRFATEVGTIFAAAAFLTSALVHHLDKALALNVSSPWIDAAVGAAVIVIATRRLGWRQ